jgi:hypothetical protein
MWIIGELGNLLNFGESSVESFENLSNVRSWLHRDDSELILLINPCKESLFIIVIDTSVLRPVPIQSTCIKEPVSLLEEEMILNQLFPILLRQGVERVILTFQLTFKFGKSLSDFCFDLSPLFGGVQSWAKWVAIKISPDSNSSGLDHSSLIWREVRGIKLH